MTHPLKAAFEFVGAVAAAWLLVRFVATYLAARRDPGPRYDEYDWDHKGGW